MMLQSPPALRGTEKSQLEQVHAYLYRMSQALNTALNSLSVESFRPEARKLITSACSREEVAANAQTLKAMIVKTARQVTARMDEISAQLKEEYVAQSQWGEYSRELTNQMQATAQGVVQQFDYHSRLDALDASMAGFLRYETDTRQYIRTGLLFYDEQGLPRYGVAVGEQQTTVDQDGQPVLDRSGLLATFTSDRLSFWQNGQETAWISNGQWCTRDLQVLSALTLGPWELSHDAGLVVKCVEE